MVYSQVSYEAKQLIKERAIGKLSDRVLYEIGDTHRTTKKEVWEAYNRKEINRERLYLELSRLTKLQQAAANEYREQVDFAL